MGAVSGRIATHIRGNAVGYVAVFIALSGTAYAALPKNSVKSSTIKNGQVKNVDLGSSAVSGSKIANGGVPASKLGGGIPASKLAGGITGALIQDLSLGGSDLADNSLSGTQIDESSLDASQIPNVVQGNGKIKTAVGYGSPGGALAPTVNETGDAIVVPDVATVQFDCKATFASVITLKNTSGGTAELIEERITSGGATVHEDENLANNATSDPFPDNQAELSKTFNLIYGSTESPQSAQIHVSAQRVAAVPSPFGSLDLCLYNASAVYSR